MSDILKKSLTALVVTASSAGTMAILGMVFVPLCFAFLCIISVVGAGY